MPPEHLKPLLVRARDLLQKLLAPLGLRPSRVVAGHRFYFDPTTDIGLEIWALGGFEKDAIAACAGYIRPDGIVIDVGANVGVHTVHFAARARLGQVICFEPARSTFAYLLKNIAHLSNVIPLNVALAGTAAIQPFFVAADNAYSGLKDTSRKPILRQEMVACVRGDDILPGLLGDRRVDLVKIDVEGLETEVLRGMRRFLEIHRPVIFCEIFGGARSNPDPQATVKFCTSLGYDAFVLRDGHLCDAGIHSDNLYNYFFLPKSRLGGSA